MSAIQEINFTIFNASNILVPSDLLKESLHDKWCALKFPPIICRVGKDDTKNACYSDDEIFAFGIKLSKIFVLGLSTCMKLGETE